MVVPGSIRSTICFKLHWQYQQLLDLLKMSSSHLAKLWKPPDSTRALLQKHLITLPDLFKKLFLSYVWNFIDNKSYSLSTNPGYISTSLITTTSFIAGSASTLVTGTQEMPLNIYSIFVGPPTTGKSQAIKECVVSPMVAVVRESDSPSPVIQKCASSGLIRQSQTTKRVSSCPVRYTMCYLNYWSLTKRMPLETCKFCVSYFQQRKLPTGMLQKEHARLHQTHLQTWSYTSSICCPPCHGLRPGTCLTDQLSIVISKMPQAIPTRNEPSSGSIKRKCSFKLQRYLHRNCSITYIPLKLQTNAIGKWHWMVSMKSSLQKSIRPLQKAEPCRRQKRSKSFCA